MGFIEIGKYGLNIKTPTRLWQLFADSDGVCKAWCKNMLRVSAELRP